MEHFEIKTEKLTYDVIKRLAAENGLRSRLKPNENFYIPTPNAVEVEALLAKQGITFKKMTHPTYNLILFTVLN